MPRVVQSGPRAGDPAEDGCSSQPSKRSSAEADACSNSRYRFAPMDRLPLRVFPLARAENVASGYSPGSSEEVATNGLSPQVALAPESPMRYTCTTVATPTSTVSTATTAVSAIGTVLPRPERRC